MTKAKAKPKKATPVDDRIVALEQEVANLQALSSKVTDLYAQVGALEVRLRELEAPGTYLISAVIES